MQANRVFLDINPLAFIPKTQKLAETARHDAVSRAHLHAWHDARLANDVLQAVLDGCQAVLVVNVKFLEICTCSQSPAELSGFSSSQGGAQQTD